MRALALVLALLGAAAGGGRAQAGAGVAYVPGSGGSCGALAPCVTLHEGLADPNVTSLVLLGDVVLGDGTAAPAAGPLRLLRNVTISAPAGSGPADAPSVDFNFISNAVTLGEDVTLTLRGLFLKNMRKGNGLDIDYFVGAARSRLHLDGSYRWRWVCTSAASVVNSSRSYPRAAGEPGENAVRLADVCVRGECYNDSVVHEDYALLVGSDSGESEEYLPGYVVRLTDVPRLCQTYISQECAERLSPDVCQLDNINAWLKSQEPNERLKVDIAVGTSLGVAALALIVIAAVWLRTRRRGGTGAGGDLEAGPGGPLLDTVLSSNKSGWQVMLRGAADATKSVHELIQLGVLLGAGSFGRVYKGRWQGREVAVKVMQHDARTAARVANEVELMLSFEHANIVQAFDFITWTHGGRASASNNAVRDSKSQTWDQQRTPSAEPRKARRASGASGASGDGGEAAAKGTPARAAADAARARFLALARAPSQHDEASSGSLAQRSSDPQHSAPLAPPQPPERQGLVLNSDGPGQPPPAAPAAGVVGPACHVEMTYVPHVKTPQQPWPAAASTGPLCAGEVSTGSAVAMPLSAPAAAAAAPGDAAAAAAAAAPRSGAAMQPPAVRPPTIGSAGGASQLGSAPDPSAEAQTWLIVEYCDGGTLADAVASGRLHGEGGAPHLGKILARLREVAAGMGYLHSRSVLHGDLKAANVLLSSQRGSAYGLVSKVSDFGLSRMLNPGATHRSTRTMGTITHQSPELLRLGKMSPAGDVYSFGILMWELFTGEVAFGAVHYGEVFERVVLHGDRPPVPEGMPDDYALLMTSCWRADPTARPSFDSIAWCVRAMLEALSDAGLEDSGAGAAGSGGARAHRGSSEAVASNAFVQDLF